MNGKASVGRLLAPGMALCAFLSAASSMAEIVVMGSGVVPTASSFPPNPPHMSGIVLGLPFAPGSIEINNGSVLSQVSTLGVPPFPNPTPSIAEMIAGPYVNPAPLGEMYIAQQGGAGTVIVRGSGSALVVTQSQGPGILLGQAGVARMEILQGATVTTSNLVLSSSSGLAPGVSSTLIVDGLGSRLDSSGIFHVGNSYLGTATISSGGVVTSRGSQNVARRIGGDGAITVTGGGSLLQIDNSSTARAFLNIGRSSTGRVDVLDGGKVLIQGAAIGTDTLGINIGGAGGVAGPNENFLTGDGTLKVSGAGSEVRIKESRGFTTVGRQGKGSIEIAAGGQIIMEDLTNGISIVGRDPRSTGAVTIDGANSLWQAGRVLYIGQNATATTLLPTGPGGNGSVQLVNGGKIHVGDRVYVGATGTLQGHGTVTGHVESIGTLAPGNSTGNLDVLGNVIAGGTLAFELAGMIDYDRLRAADNPVTVAIDGKIEVTGKLHVTFLNGFSPVAGNTFDVITGTTVTAGAATFELPTLFSGLGWQHSVVSLGNGQEALRLSVAVAAIPEPETYALMLAGLGLVGIAARRRKRV